MKKNVVVIFGGDSSEHDVHVCQQQQSSKTWTLKNIM